MDRNAWTFDRSSGPFEAIMDPLEAIADPFERNARPFEGTCYAMTRPRVGVSGAAVSRADGKN